MKISNLFNSDDRAVSPVIGVILMVAITVILAAVIGTFVLGLGDQLGDSAPQASFSVENVSNDNVTFVKTGGQVIDGDDLTLSIDGERHDNPIGEGTWQSGEQRDAAYDSNPSDQAVVRIIHDPSGSAIFEQTVDFSNVS